MDSYDENQFAGRIEAARRVVRLLLDNTRTLQRAADVPHRYDDKYLLAEVAANLTIASLVQSLEVMGMTDDAFGELRAWASARSVTLRLSAEETCRFLREESHKVESPEIVTEKRGFLGTSKETQKVVATVTEYFWSFDFHYEILAYEGSQVDKGVLLTGRSGAVEIKTSAKKSPRPERVVRTPIEANVTWLFQHIDAEKRPHFRIDRAASSCHTPRRNQPIDDALTALGELFTFAGNVQRYFQHDLFSAQLDHRLDLSAIHDTGVFVPVVPLLEESEDGARVLPQPDLDLLLAQQRRALTERCRDLASVFPQDSSVITAVEAGLVVTLLHARRICQGLQDSVDYIEGMLRAQLVAAIGKELTPADFNAYMTFHNRKLVKPAYRPKPFSYAVRRAGHDPEGIVSLEAKTGIAPGEPIFTTVKATVAERPMTFALDASTRVSFLGERHVHAFIGHQFSGTSGLALSLVARARQFSSFVLMVGRIASADVFEPRYAIILQNKDLLKIPLMLEQLPTPKEFRDAIESLSPEQQRFAKAFRGMQLESTLFAVCVVQIKPQLEKLLKLPADSLTKEIRLTEDLLGLFIEHQIPSDLVSYDGPEEAEAEAKLERVKEYVERMNEMISSSKQREIDEEREREALRRAEANVTYHEDEGTPFAPPPPMAYGAPPPPPSFGPPVMPASMPMGGAMPRRSTTMVMAAPGAAPPLRAPPPPMASPAAAPPPPPAPVPRAATTGAAAPTPVAPTPPAQRTPEDRGDAPPADAGGVDYTRIPAALDRRFEELDEDGALRATILSAGEIWTKSSQKGLLSTARDAALHADEQEKEKSRAFDLLDALTKSGALAIDDASLHIVLAATHCFDRTLVETVIRDNVNPIEKVERSLLIIATTIHGASATEILAEDQRARFLATSPRLGEG